MIADIASARSGRPWLSLALLTLALVAPALASLAGDPYLVKLATRIVIYGLAAAALDLVLGVAGLVSFGHGAFLGLGAYAVGVMFQHGFEGSTLFGLEPTQNLLLLAPLAILASALFALVTGAICLRTRGVAFIMITLAFAQMLFFFFTSLERYNGDDGIALWSRNELPGPLDPADDVTFYYICLACLAVFLAWGRRMLLARFGRVLRAAKENERRMLALGFAVQRYRLAAYAISGAVTGLAGLLLANQSYFVSPAVMSWHSSGQLIVMVVLGGLGTLIGPVVGAAAFLLLEDLTPSLLELLAPGFGRHWQLLLGPILVAVALFAHRGLVGALSSSRHD
jgi:branched-chain amino acid transport system permease protein